MGLVPDDLAWVSGRRVRSRKGRIDAEHNHHDRQIVRERAMPPGRDTSDAAAEVHAYVSPARRASTWCCSRATQTGTFIVQCDLHPEKVGKLVGLRRRPAPRRSAGISTPAAGAGACAEQGSRVCQLSRCHRRARRSDVHHRRVREAGTGRSAAGHNAGTRSAHCVPADRTPQRRIFLWMQTRRACFSTASRRAVRRPESHDKLAASPGDHLPVRARRHVRDRATR